MSRHRRIYSLTVASALLTLSACGGGGGGNTPSTGANPITPQACSLRDRQEWAIDSLREWYLFPDTLPANIDPANYATVDELIEAYHSVGEIDQEASTVFAMG